MFTVALTGGIGCGKTTACLLFSDFNVPIVDTDIISRELVQPGTPALQEITSYFGENILTEDGHLDRKKLAANTFNNKHNREKLESILHPEIRKEVGRQLKSLKSTYAVVAIPLLFETEQNMNYDRVLVIDCNEQQQINRTLHRDQRSIEEINAIMASQVSREFRLQHADDIIDNSGSADLLKEQVKKLHQKYLALAN